MSRKFGLLGELEGELDSEQLDREEGEEQGELVYDPNQKLCCLRALRSASRS